MGYKERLATRAKIQSKLRSLPAERHRCDKYPCSDETCEHHRTPLEQELSAKVAAVLKSVPAYSRATIEGIPWVDVRVVCAGRTPVMAYYCCMKPGHSGRCYSASKQVHFTPEVAA
jgi:hypothetical protein